MSGWASRRDQPPARGRARQEVLPIDDNDRGTPRHHPARAVATAGGGLLIDTPGMRSFGLAEDDGGVAAGFCRRHLARRRLPLQRLPPRRRTGLRRRPGARRRRPRARPPGVVPRKLDREAQAAERRSNTAKAARPDRRKAVHMAMRARAKVDPKLRR
jgi:hypothetical protein